MPARMLSQSQQAEPTGLRSGAEFLPQGGRMLRRGVDLKAIRGEANRWHGVICVARRPADFAAGTGKHVAAARSRRLAPERPRHTMLSLAFSIFTLARSTYMESFFWIVASRLCGRCRKNSVSVAPDEEGCQCAAFCGIEAAGQRVLRGKRIHVAAEQVMQETLRFFARDLEHAELRQVAQYGAVARGDALGGGIAEMLHHAVLHLRALGSQKILPILIHCISRWLIMSAAILPRRRTFRLNSCAMKALLFRLVMLVACRLRRRACGTIRIRRRMRASPSFTRRFTERPKHLDPAQAYSENEYEFLALIYAPPLQYHYLKRPYQLVPLAASEMPTVTLSGQESSPLAG